MKSFSSWIRENAVKLRLEAEELSWIGEFYPNMSDISVRLEINGKEFYGRGHLELPEEALQVAVAEALERAIAAQEFQTTNGVAVHTNLELAKINARNELIERDLFLSHFRTQTPFKYIPTGQSFLPKPVCRFVESRGDEISVYRMAKTNFGSGYVTLISGSRIKGCVIGLSFGSDTEVNLIRKANLEAYRQYWHLDRVYGFQNNLDLDKFKSLQAWNFQDHGSLALNPSYFLQIHHLFPRIDNFNPDSDLVKYTEREFSYQDLTLKGFPDCPLSGVRCTSPLTQDLELGPPKSINSLGLKRFTQTSFQLNDLPHPLN